MGFIRIPTKEGSYAHEITRAVTGNCWNTASNLSDKTLVQTPLSTLDCMPPMLMILAAKNNCSKPTFRTSSLAAGYRKIYFNKIPKLYIHNNNSRFTKGDKVYIVQSSRVRIL